ncbi:MAG: flagellar export chaperone FliS [Oscillospiraceae bacterium]|jgi:flagellar protein FliS
MRYLGTDPRKEYLRQGVMTASPAELVAMLFGAAVKNLKLAIMAYEDSKDICTTNDCLIKAQRVISELISSLDMNIELSAQLARVYEFMLRELRYANVHKDMKRVEPIIGMLESMRDTWKTVAQQQRKGMAEGF